MHARGRDVQRDESLVHHACNLAGSCGVAADGAGAGSGIEEGGPEVRLDIEPVVVVFRLHVIAVLFGRVPLGEERVETAGAVAVAGVDLLVVENPRVDLLDIGLDVAKLAHRRAPGVRRAIHSHDISREGDRGYAALNLLRDARRGGGRLRLDSGEVQVGVRVDLVDDGVPVDDMPAQEQLVRKNLADQLACCPFACWLRDFVQSCPYDI